MAFDTIFRIYSMTKAITSVAIMMLYERGLFALDDPIGKYAPCFARANMRVVVGGNNPHFNTAPSTTAITFIHLLTHTRYSHPSKVPSFNLTSFLLVG